jgi:23S rRNA pseudouridine955/2504/2580 synthase
MRETRAAHIRSKAGTSISKMNGLGKESARLFTIDEAHASQRLDNFLLSLLKGVPKSHIHRIVRNGEVRVNSRRATASSRLAVGDRVRIPPIRLATRAETQPPAKFSRLPILFEDEFIFAVDKPAGIAVHGGSGVSFGVIEQLRLARPGEKFLELVHRLDKGTSGVLLLAKKRVALLALHAALTERKVEKRYLVLVRGQWARGKSEVSLPLRKYVSKEGERRVFSVERKVAGLSLLRAELRTGRTHQIRVQLAHLGFPIAGDDKYGDFAWNRELAKMGLKRMFLHAERVAFRHPASGERLSIVSPLPKELVAFLEQLS